ncbi:MAG TPA: LytTR family transcriptional regulator DNA-binding domain-containing protein [Bacteroidales bacterium]|nr:response regulator [Bacteroidales bacterium]HNR41093.1 LytTR family transcriptional regulator DNA-binding domain-containing protein [Bacteroidales bacterium]HPM17671.1 LytTR family transcriptional regulator DNA-binding domain-containing protein [Bacteroidales bacterium]
MNNVLRCIAIDSDPLVLDMIGEFCTKVYYLDLTGKYTDPFRAYQILNENKVDLMFLDVRMPQITGAEFLNSLYNPPMVIFTSSFKEHALEGFECDAVDYLVKPFAFDRFFKAVNKAFQLQKLKKPVDYLQDENSQPAQRFLMVKVEYSTIRVDLREILYIEGLKDYVKIHCGSRLLLTKTTMKNILEKLPQEIFFRVHKSYIVAVEKIDMIENSRIIIGNQRIPIGESFRSSFFSLVSKNLV